MINKVSTFLCWINLRNSGIGKHLDFKIFLEPKWCPKSSVYYYKANSLLKLRIVPNKWYPKNKYENIHANGSSTRD